MSKMFYPKLAGSNVKKNSKTYVPFMITCIFTVALFYIMKSLSLNDGISKMMGANTINYTLDMGCWVVAFFSAIFLFYTNSFLMKRRKKEFGLFNILGMEKKHIAKVITLETLYIASISIVSGIVVGILFDKAMYLIIMKVMGFNATLGFYISYNAIITSVILFGGIFLLILLNSIRQIHLAKPIELLNGQNTGEREPKTKLLMAILGVICLAIGYFISLYVKDPIATLLLFFVAVILVIIGTYLLFTAGSIVLLKLLRKNKHYYYKTKNFVSISGMLYRMKQNAVGLANICVLSTMVLVMVSSTTSLMLGIDDTINARYPNDISMNIYNSVGDKKDKVVDIMHNTAAKNNLAIEKEVTFKFITASLDSKNNTFYSGNFNSNSMFFVPLSDYNNLSGENKVLKDGEILLYTTSTDYNDDTINIFEREYKIKERIDDFPNKNAISGYATSNFFIITKDINELKYIDSILNGTTDDLYSNIKSYYGVDTSGSDNEQIKLYKDVFNETANNGLSPLTVNSKAAARNDINALYGGMFFLGIFLGILFIVATILIIYYKQISEGYDDKERFEIMQKVGMSHAEVKKSIHSQIITVFFLPLITACIHVTFAFPAILRILKALNLDNTSLFVICTIACFIIFAILYSIIYATTAKVYYKIVSR